MRALFRHTETPRHREKPAAGSRQQAGFTARRRLPAAGFVPCVCASVCCGLWLPWVCQPGPRTGRSSSGRRATGSTRARRLPTPGRPGVRAWPGARRWDRASVDRWSRKAASSSFIASATKKSSKRSTRGPATSNGDTRTRRRIAMTSGSTKVRARCLSSSMASSTRSAPRASSMRSILRRARASGARTRRSASARKKASLAALDHRSSRTDASSPTSAGRAPASSRSMRRAARSSGPPPTMRGATRRR